MKFLHAACLLGLLPVLALADPIAPPPDSSKPQPFEPVLAKYHQGLGRIGVRLTFDKVSGVPQISALTRGGPAADFGFMVGDVIIRIDKNLTTTLTEDEVSLALHGEPGSGVELTVQREGAPKLIICAIERRILPAGSEDMIQPPIPEAAKP